MAHDSRFLINKNAPDAAEISYKRFYYYWTIRNYINQANLQELENKSLILTQNFLVSLTEKDESYW